MFQRTVMPYSATPPKPAITRSFERLVDIRDVADRAERHTVACGDHARNLGASGSIFSPSTADDGVAVVHQMMREREAGGTESHDEHLVAGARLRERPVEIQRIPARQQAVDLEAPRQIQHILQRSRFDLRDVHRILLLVDASLHAVIADTVPGAGAIGLSMVTIARAPIGVAVLLRHVHLGDLFFERAAVQRDSEGTLLKLAGLFLAVRWSRSPCPGYGT